MQNNALETEAVWRAFSKPLRAFVSRRVARAEDADDILQEVFVRIHRRLGSVRQNGSLAAWLFQIARNVIADHYRSKHSQVEALAEDFDAPSQNSGEPEALTELSACVAPMVVALPERYRQALVLTDIDGLTQQEAALRLGVSLSGMKSRVQRGRRKIKDMLLACCLVQLDRRGGVVDAAPRDREDYARWGCGGGCEQN